MDKKKFSLKEIGVTRLLILLLAGIVLIFLSLSETSSKQEGQKDSNDAAINGGTTKEEESKGISEYEKRLTQILSKVEGVGQVEVMITEKESKELVVLKDKPYTQETLNETDQSGGVRISDSTKSEEETVLSGGSSSAGTPFVTKEVAAKVEGVLVIAEGGANGKVAANITAAVQALFGIEAHKIKVLPMTRN